MRKLLILIALLIVSFHQFIIYSQSGESKYKMVIFSSETKKVIPLYPSFDIMQLRFSNPEMNQVITGGGTGTFELKVKNTGTILLNELKVSLVYPDGIRGLHIGPAGPVQKLGIGDSVNIKIPVVADNLLEDGVITFLVRVKDSATDSIKNKEIKVIAKAGLRPPVIKWINPLTVRDSVDYRIFALSAFVASGTSLTDLKLYLNGNMQSDKKSFIILPTENPNEWRLERTINLSEGENIINIEASNAGGTARSDPRILDYFIERVDQSYTEKRLALVIGNSNYQNSPQLKNPVNDAEAITRALENLGFRVLKYTDASLRTMKKAIDDFGEELKKYNVGLFYYAGHGMQVKGNNYLIPVDAAPKIENDVEYDCVDAGRLLGKMEDAGANTNIVILDACRDNPFSRSWSSRSSAKGDSGLAYMNAPSGSIIAYATAPGKTASDGLGSNGIYTEAMLQYINVPGLTIEDFFKYVRIEVMEKTDKQQIPWEYTSLKGNFYFRIK